MPAGERGRDSSRQIESAPPASAPVSPRAPSSGARPPADSVAWGGVRDSITAIHNLEVLLKSPRVGTRVLAEVLHEFVNGITVLRGAFLQAAASAGTERALLARRALAEFTRGGLDELERAMQRALSTDFDARGRLGLEHVVGRVSIDLDAAAELLDLSERAEHAAPTELSLQELTRVSFRPTPGAEGDGAIPVRLARSEVDCVLRTDPHVFKRMTTFAIGRAHALGAAEPVIRVQCDEERAWIDVGPLRPADAPIVPMMMRLARRIEPTDAVVDAAAGSAAIDVAATGAVVTLSMARVRT